MRNEDFTWIPPITFYGSEEQLYELNNALEDYMKHNNDKYTTLKKDFEFLSNDQSYKPVKLMLIKTKAFYKIEELGFVFTDDELEIADKRKDGYIGEKNGVDCYLTKFI